MKKFYIYDIETMLNCFLFTGKLEGDSRVDIFEISDRKNQRSELLSHLSMLQSQGYILVGYHNLGFDYPIIHDLLVNPHTFDAKRAYLLAQEIIGRQEYGFTAIRYNDRILPQLDLVKINHFDNKARRTRLKDLQFAMRSASVEDLPFDFRRPLTFEQMDKMIDYNKHDVTETEAFFVKCKPAIKMREELLENKVIYGDVLNYSDVRIGREYLIKKIGRNKCFNGPKPKQTFRNEIAFKDLILPKIFFKTEQFQEVYNWFTQQKFWLTKAERPSLKTKLAGLDFHFGLGGLHASVENKVFIADDDYVIKDIDVSGMYVAVAIANGFYPEHLGNDFVQAYKQLQRDRAQYPKGTTMNAILKLAGNGVYGSSNDSYSCFYDPKYTYSVTINGQLQLLQLVELLSLIPQLQIIQANTDGITVKMHKSMVQFFQLWCNEWEAQTGLKLEEVNYSKMFIRDVNNYIAVKTNGSVKRKGAYWYPITDQDYEGVWNKDFSNITAPKIAEQVMLNGWQIKDIIKLNHNPFDFMMRYKTSKGSKLMLNGFETQKTLRYYVSHAGGQLKKFYDPKGAIGDYKRKNGIPDEYYKRILSEIPAGTWDERIHTKNKSKYQVNVTNVEAGFLVKECNKASNFSWDDLNYDYYIDTVRKLLIGEQYV